MSARAPRPASIVLGLLMALTAGLAAALAPRLQLDASTQSRRLETLVPRQFGAWRALEAGDALTGVTPRAEAERERQFYDQTLLRTYAGPGGARVMLALAYGKRQRQETKVHRPELCYVSQGFEILSKQSAVLKLTQGSIPVTRLIARSAARYEPVTYWVRLGEGFSSGAVATRLTLLKEGLLGNIPDGILVRVSTRTRDGAESQAAFAIQQAFLRALINALDRRGKEVLLGKQFGTLALADG
jgi:EpsI family protein